MIRNSENRFPWAYVAISFGFTWLILLPAVLATSSLLEMPFPSILLVAIAQFGPSLAAFILVYRGNGKVGLIRFLRRAVDFRIPLRWLLAIVLIPLALTGTAMYLSILSGRSVPPSQVLPGPAGIPLTFVFIFFLQGPVPEEFGWRGYALDRLQSRYNALTASLIVGVMWGIWHLPLFYIGYLLFPAWAYLIAVPAFSVLFTWLYNNTGGNLLVALLFHTMINLSIALFPPIEQNAFLYLTVLYVVVALLVTLIWRPQSLSRSVL
jgi:membrane protease YdiL (CAAX protease family)